jgi:branched-chain amino acid transport system substrate-binding protein
MQKSISRRDFLKLAGAVGALSTAGLTFSTSCGTKAQPGQVLKVGLMTPSTGPVPEKGKPGQHGLEDCYEYINTELNGVHGYQIQPVWRDSGYNASQVPLIVNEFMDQGCILFTTHSSTEMNWAKAISDPAEFPGIATYTSQTNYHPPKHVYGQMPDYGDDWVAFAKYYKEKVWKGSGNPKMALHLLNNPTGKGAEYAADAMADQIGIDIVAKEEHAATDASAIESLSRIKTKNPDVLFISSTPQPTAVILKDARSLGMTPAMTVGSAHAGFTKALVDLAGSNDVVEGVYGVFPTVTWEEGASGLKKASQYLQKNNPGDANNMDYLSTWATALVVAQVLKLAVENAGYDALKNGDVASWRAVEKEGIQRLNGYNVEGIQGPVKYTSGDNRLGKSLRLYKITGGNIGMIQDWSEAPFIKYEDFSWFPK